MCLLFQSASQLHNVKSRKEKRFHIDDTPTGIDLAKDLVVSRTSQDNSENNMDSICSLAVSEKILLVARVSGVINEYSIEYDDTCSFDDNLNCLYNLVIEEENNI